MSKLVELIQELCPDGVEYKPLGDICIVSGRIGFRGYTKQDQVEKGEGALSLSPSNIGENGIDFSNSTYINWDKYNESPEIMVSNGDIIFTKTASVGKTEYVDNLPCKATINPQLVLIKEIKCNSKYLSYVLKTKEFQKKVMKIKGQGTIPTISQKEFIKLTVPVPPLEVQKEIVRLLDEFTAKTEELQTELNKEYEVRKKQYEYYQNLLLNDKFGAEYKELGDVVTFLNGRAYKQSELLNSGKYKVLRVGNFYTNNQWYYSDLELEQNKYCQKGDLLYTWAATIGPQIWDGEKVIYHYHIWKLVFDNSILNMHYLYHYLKKDINDISNSLTNSTMPHVSMSSMKKRMISIPPMETQQEIVRLLDNLTEKTEELQDKLNEELESRQKQYEYYRDKLLTFKELK